MNHLFVEVSIGDDCTWSATVTHPAFGESPKAFLEALEIKWMEQTLALEEVRAEMTKHEDQLHRLLERIAKLEAGKEHKPAYEALLGEVDELNTKRSGLNEKMSALYEVKLGGCCLDLEDLNAGDEFFAPRVYDLEQYFAKALERFNLEQKNATK